ncbi:MAG: hypothetical protein ABW127_03340 [Candidatus Thiodiazotropha endolucinida]
MNQAVFLYPNDHLELLIDVISQPADYCDLTNKRDCLERHNVKVAAELGNEVPYAEIRIGKLKRYGLIVKYPLNEVKNQSRIASKMESIYGNSGAGIQLNPAVCHGNTHSRLLCRLV